ncbi:MAG TPA: hypothetical protein VNA04_10700 [Thermoanaerobaculia bacterium]|nr:hypothetical protein [Thermoanaerobaculia bacterium]
MDEKALPIAMTREQLRELALRVAAEMKAAGPAVAGKPAGSGGGSRHRGLPEDLRARFIDVRAALFQRGIFDPVLVRFDTASADQASAADIANQLASVAASL